MAKDQKEIYYLTGLDLEALERDPALEAFRKKDWEVLFLDDPLDEFVVEHLQEFEGKSFKPAQSADIKVEKESAADREYLKRVDGFVAFLKTTFGQRVADVRISERLVDSPCLLVDPSAGPSIQVEKILKMAHKDYQFTRKILEINPDNGLIQEMVRIHAAKPASPLLKKMALQLLDNLLLREGVMTDIESVVPRIQEIMLQAAKTVRSPSKPKPSKTKASKPKPSGR
jgi:molecular chaperone HtpG